MLLVSKIKQERRSNDSSGLPDLTESLHRCSRSWLLPESLKRQTKKQDARMPLYSCTTTLGMLSVSGKVTKCVGWLSYLYTSLVVPKKILSVSNNSYSASFKHDYGSEIQFVTNTIVPPFTPIQVPEATYLESQFKICVEEGLFGSCF